MTEDSDQELIARSRAGDRDAYAALYERYSASGLRFATTLTGDPARAADLVSEAFIKIMALLDEGRGPDANFSSYLFTSIRNVMIDDLRRHRREELVDDVTNYRTGQHVVRDHAADQAESTVINRAFASLPERWREVLWYTEVLDESLETVAARFGAKPNAVGVLSWRAREGFRQAYLAEHLAVSTDPACAKFAPQIPRYVRHELTATRSSDLEAHLAECEFCPVAVTDLENINSNLGALLLPLALLVPATPGATGPAHVVTHGLLVKGGSALVAVVAAATAVAVWIDQPARERPTDPSTAMAVPTVIPMPPGPQPTRAPGRRPVGGPATTAPPPRPTVAPPVPLPPLQLAGPDVFVVRTSQTTDARITTALNRTGRGVTLLVRIANARAFRLLSAGRAWTCRASRSAPGTVAERCVGGSAPAFSFDVSVADPGQELHGRIDATGTQGSAASSFTVPATASPGP